MILQILWKEYTKTEIKNEKKKEEMKMDNGHILIFSGVK